MKPKRRKFFLISLTWEFLLLVILPIAISADIPQEINYQGYLTDSEGNPIDGTVTIVFSIYSEPSDSTTLWNETRAVTVTEGEFSVNLGDVNPIDLPFDQQYYLGVEVNGDGEMTPRKPLTSVGYAFAAASIYGNGNNYIMNSNDTNALTIVQTGDVGKSRSSSGALLIDNTGNPNTGLAVYTNSGLSAERPLVRFEIDDPDFQPEVLRITSDSLTSRGLIRLDSPAPEIEFVETDQVAPDGKFEIRVQNNEFQINSRNIEDDSFERYLYLNGPLSEGGQLILLAATTSPTREIFRIDNQISSAGARPGISWHNTPGDLTNARLSAKTGDGHTNSQFFIEVANRSRVLQDRLTIDVDGNVGVGTINPIDKLEVVGNIRVTSGGFIDDGRMLDVPDHVFGQDNVLMSLDELRTYIAREKHLPDMPSAKQIVREGLNLGQFQMKLLKKIEELTLYTLAQQEILQSQQAKIEALETKLRQRTQVQ